MRCELSSRSWDLLWDLRMSLQAMLQRRLRCQQRSLDPGAKAQDRRLIALLVDLLNSTQPGTEVSTRDADAPKP